MITGAANMDGAIVVVAASDGQMYGYITDLIVLIIVLTCLVS